VPHWPTDRPGPETGLSGPGPRRSQNTVRARAPVLPAASCLARQAIHLRGPARGRNPFGMTPREVCVHSRRPSSGPGRLPSHTPRPAARGGQSQPAMLDHVGGGTGARHSAHDDAPHDAKADHRSCSCAATRELPSQRSKGALDEGRTQDRTRHHRPPARPLVRSRTVRSGPRGVRRAPTPLAVPCTCDIIPSSRAPPPRVTRAPVPDGETERRSRRDVGRPSFATCRSPRGPRSRSVPRAQPVGCDL
jgi:hypothetical protein